jgi:hypothetical protein
METQIKFYKVMAVSAGLYGSENWVLTDKDKNRIQAAEMRFLRSMTEVTRQDRLSNEAIRKTLNVTLLANIEIIGLTMSHEWITVVFRDTCYHTNLLEREV